MKDAFEKNIHLPPSDAYRPKLANVACTTFAAGNRTGAGKSLKVSQQIKNENRKDHPDLQPLHAKIAKLQEEIRHKDQETAKDLKQFNQKIYGCTDMLQLVPDLKMVLLHESLIRLYHGIASRDLVYFDSTGSVVQKVLCFKRICTVLGILLEKLFYLVFFISNQKHNMGIFKQSHSSNSIKETLITTISDQGCHLADFTAKFLHSGRFLKPLAIKE